MQGMFEGGSQGGTVIRAPADSCAERNAGAEELEELARDL